ncbi:MAG TPA: transposase [Anaerolineales bacterium]|nr:transposase [Anaerolineales bacterium]
MPMPSDDPIPPIPADTARSAKAVYSRSNLYLSIGDRLAELLADIHLNNSLHREAPSRLGKPSLALVTFFQYLEKLSDRQAVEATSTRIDWKYALHLSMHYPGLNPGALCDFRQSLLRLPEKQGEFQRFLERLEEGGYAREAQGQPLETLRVLDELCIRTRLDIVMSAMRHVLQALATHHPEWLRRISPPRWYSRYEMAERQPDLAQSAEQQRLLAEAIGVDIAFLLQAIPREEQPKLASLKEVQELEQVWREQFDLHHRDSVKLLPYCYYCGTVQQRLVE